MCVWLPLALADIAAAFAALGGREVARSELLESWALPALASAARRGELQAGLAGLDEWARSVAEAQKRG